MTVLLQVVPGIFGLILGSLVLLTRRFGPGNWLLACYVLSPAIGFGMSGFSDGTLPSIENNAVFAFSSIILSLPFICLFLWTIDQPDYLKIIGGRWKTTLAVIVPVPVALTMTYAARAVVSDRSALAEGFVALGPGGYLSSVYGLVVSVVVLATVEQIIRTVDERVRWEIKFLLLGIAGSLAATIYVASKILLFGPRYALLPMGALQIFPIVYGISIVLIFLSWRRSTGRATIALSQRIVYSSITLLSVGVYLIVSSLLARWIGQVTEFNIQTETLTFLVLALALGSLLLWTAFQQRARLWIRRNIFSGHYDYRLFWMEATETIRSTESDDRAAGALASMTQEALGAIDISVFLRERRPDRLLLLASRGIEHGIHEFDLSGMVPDLLRLNAPTRVTDLRGERILELCRRTQTELLAPLVSSDRLVGVLTVGPDRSGRAYGTEAKEFLRVLAAHAAGEFHKRDLLATLMEAKEMEAFRTFSTFLLHDLKNFASTLSLISRNAAKHGTNPAFVEDAFNSVFETSEKMKRLCNSLKTFSGNLAANRKVQDVNQLIRAVADNMRGALGDSLHLETEDVPPIVIDCEEISRVVQNLVLNAREAISREGKVTVRTSQTETHVEIAVIDDGQGMSPEFLQQELFHPFHTTKSDGLGIGLFQCKRIVDAHGGTIQVRSGLGKGTTVFVRLPK